MSTSSSTIFKKSIKFILLLIIFQCFWLLFYFLSNREWLELRLWNSYFKQAVINSIGFVGFVLAAFWLFPMFISRKKIVWFIVISLLLVVLLGNIQYIAQDWFLQPTHSPVKLKHNQMPAITLKQIKGAKIYAMLNITVYMLLGLGYGYMKDNIKKEKRTSELEKEKIAAELALLRYQLNPHFLFNTINDIYYLAIIQSEKTGSALLQLSNLLRYVLNEKETSVSLDREIDYLEQYILLHHFRFPEEVIKKDFQLGYNYNQYQIAPLLLITFIENAFKHGEPGSKDCLIKISLKRENKKLYYEVTNRVNLITSKDNSTGIGLPNLKRRLALLYSEKHLIKTTMEGNLFTAKLEIDLYD